MLPGSKNVGGTGGGAVSGYSRGGFLPVFPLAGRSSGPINKSFAKGSAVPSLFNMQFLTAALKVNEEKLIFVELYFNTWCQLFALEPRIDDDIVDRLNYYYTTTIMIVFAIMVSAKQYVGHPIECWVPAQFTKAMEQYTENYCWIQNTYWVPFGDLIPSRMGDRERRQIGYYQWVPFILALEALLFYIPATLWRMLNTQSGLNLLGILQLATDDRNIEPENRIHTVNILSRHINDALRYQRDFGTKEKSIYLWAFIKIGKLFGAYCTLLYCLVKGLYLVNVIGQFILLNRFLETNEYPFFGAHIVWDLLHGTEWRNSGKFPRVTLCDFDIRVLGNIHRHTVQCVLVINMFTEKIFIFLWLWLLMLTIVTSGNLIFYLITLLIPTFRINFVTKYLALAEGPLDLGGKDSRHMRRFVNSFLRPDGVFILKMISNRTGTIMCTELVYALWLNFRTTTRASPEPSDIGDPFSLEKKSLLEKPEIGPPPPPPPPPESMLDSQRRSSKGSDEPHWIKPPPLPLGAFKVLLGSVGRGKFVAEHDPTSATSNGKSRSETPREGEGSEEETHRMHL